LTGDAKTTALAPLMSAGWTEVKDREAIYKEYLFKDFNEVSFLLHPKRKDKINMLFEDCKKC
jgi:pterin-4a-carbinolamine dehydratase